MIYLIVAIQLSFAATAIFLLIATIIIAALSLLSYLILILLEAISTIYGATKRLLISH